MTIESLRRRLLRLHTAKTDFRHGLADRLAAARANRMAQRTERIRRGLPADLTPEEAIANLRTKQAEWSVDGKGEVYAGRDELGQRLFEANKRMLANLSKQQLPHQN